MQTLVFVMNYLKKYDDPKNVSVDYISALYDTFQLG